MTPVVIQDDVSIAANTTVENVIMQNTGAQRYVRAPFNAIGQLALRQSATGLRFELVVDGKTILDSSDANIASRIAIPDNIVVEQFFVRDGGQLVLRVINTTGGALTGGYRISLEEAQEQPPACRVTCRGAISIAANTTVQLLSGLRFERPVEDSVLSVLATISALGVLLEVFIDGKSVAPAFPVGTTNRIPLNPYDMLLNGIEVPKDSLIELRAQNTTGGALNIFWITMLQEIQVH